MVLFRKRAVDPRREERRRDAIADRKRFTPLPISMTSPAPSDAGTIRFARFFDPRATMMSR